MLSKASILHTSGVQVLRAHGFQGFGVTSRGTSEPSTLTRVWDQVSKAKNEDCFALVALLQLALLCQGIQAVNSTVVEGLGFRV